MKTCSHCGYELPLDCFYFNDTSHGHSANCKQCHTWNNRRRRYGLTVQELLDLEKTTHCDICGFRFEKQLDQCIDHCHAKGHVRGVICRRCNLGIGHFDDDPARLLAASEYLGGGA